MRELRDIVEASRRSQCATGLLATVVGTSGSTYRRPGARLLVLDDGTTAGSISGGCLEADVIERGRDLAVGECVTVTYDTRSDVDVVWGLGLGCNGVVTVLVERVGEGSLDWLAEALVLGERIACARVLRVDGDVPETYGARLVVVSPDPDDESVDGEWDEELLDRVRIEAGRVLADGVSSTVRFELPSGSATVFIESIEPPMRLVVLGAGQDAVPLVRQAALLGWDVTVADARPAYATASRFPEAETVLCVRPERAGESISVDERTAVVVMTHNYAHDLELLRWLVESAAFYIGVLGPRVRTERLIAEIHAREEMLARLHAPVGLDIGADSPEQIALAIAAEIQAVRAGHSAGFLRDRAGSIHLERNARSALECGVNRRFGCTHDVERANPRVNPKRRCAPHSKALRARAGVVVLAAGGSLRLGTPKQLLQFRGVSLLRNAAETAIASGCGPVVVVLGARADRLRLELDGLGVAIVENRDWRDGMGSSIRVGVEHLSDLETDVESILLTLCDQPLVTPDVLRSLVFRRHETRAPIVACAYGDTLGVPALFDAALADELACIPAERGARDLIASYGSRVASVHVPRAQVDVDTSADYARLIDLREPVTGW